MTRSEERRKAKELKVVDARELIKAKFPALVSLLTSAQIDQIQRQLDADAINAAIDIELEELDRKSIVGRTSTGQPVRDPSKVVSTDRLQRSKLIIRESETIVRLPFEKLLTPDAFKPNSDNPDEAAYLLNVKTALAVQGVWFRIFRNQSQLSHTQFTSWSDHRRWFASMWVGSDQRNEIKTESGQLSRKSILSVPFLGLGYHEYVNQGRMLRLFKSAHAAVDSKIQLVKRLHLDWDPKNGSIRGRILTWGVTEVIAPGVGRRIVYPDKQIWDEPNSLVAKASSLNEAGNLTGAIKLLVLASYQAEWGATAITEYIEGVKAFNGGVGTTLEILQIADKLGDIADALLLARSAGKFVLRRLSGSAAVTAGESASNVGAQHLSATAAPKGPVAVYENVVKSAEKTIHSQVASSPTVPSVAPSAGRGATVTGSASSPRAPSPNKAKMDMGALPLNPAAQARKQEWFNSTGRVAYLRDSQQYVEYVKRELAHLRAVNPNATMAQKNAIIDRADKIWTTSDEAAGAVSVRYSREQINVDLVGPPK